MTSAEIYQWLGQILPPLGGASVVAWGVAKYFADRSIEKHKTELGQETERLKAELGRDAETHKWKLRKKEILFEKEFEAASEFFVLRRRIEPRFRHPDMDHAEAMEEVVDRFSSFQESLRSFIAKHGPALRTKNREELDQCQQIAENNQYAKHQGEMREAEKAAEGFLKKLEEIERRFVIEIRRN
jgi:hypothetical protein